MLNTAKHITTILNTAEINALVTGGIFWELADQDAVPPFLNFSFKGSKKLTKDGSLRNYEVKLIVFTDSLRAGMAIAEGISGSLDQTSKWTESPEFIRSGYADNEAKEAFIELTYQFKL